MAIPYYNEARGHAACNMYVQLSLYVESEITTLVPLALSSFHYLQAVATESCMGGSLGTRLLIQYSTFSWGSIPPDPLDITHDM